MATTTSFPTAVNDPSSTNAANAFADDGTATDLIFSTDSDITWSSFSSLSIPGGATINGIEIIVEARGKATPNLPEFSVYNGTSWSSTLAFSGTLTRFLTVYDPGWGSSSNLWGLSWDATTAAGIQIKVDNSTLGSGRSWACDFLKVKVTYTEASGYGHDVNSVGSSSIGKVNSVATANIGKVNSVD
jgi:hypothetical protein